MASLLNPYLNFDGNAREAMEFYHSVLGGDLTIHTFGEYGGGEGVDPEGVMHAMLQSPSGFTLMASDAPPGMELQSGGSISLSLSGDDEAELRGYWEKLSVSGATIMPLEPQMWGDTFGMCVDGFGMSWMVNILGESNS